ncbi:MAG: DUF4097 family beta strand repeat-containing protein [Bacteroidota bacterium]
MKLTSYLLLCIGICSGLSFSQDTREVRKTVPLNRDGRVSIDTYKGSVKVETWEKSEVEIVATIEAEEWGRYSDDKVRETEIKISDSPGSVRIQTDYDGIRKRSGSFWGIFDGDSGSLPYVHYMIKMPSTASLRIKDYKSDIDVKNLAARFDLNTYKGRVDVTGLAGGLDLETYKGTCRVEFASFPSASSFETYKGDIDLVLPRSTGFTLDADLGRKGDFDSDFSFASSKSRSKKRSSYDGDVNGGGPTLRLRTDKGNFRVLHK